MFKFPWLWKKHSKKKKLYIPIHQHYDIYHRIRVRASDEWCKNNPGKSVADMYIDYTYPQSLSKIFLQYTGVNIKFSSGLHNDGESFFVFDNEAAYTMFLLKWSS
jgi:hypothetical protein